LWQPELGSEILYDAFIGAVGYEKRANFIPSKIGPQAKMRYASGFDARKVFSYNDNLEWFKENHFDIEETTDSNYKIWCERVIGEISSTSDKNKKICIDISSLSRYRIAVLIATLFECGGNNNISVDFLYAPATYTPPISVEGPIVTAKPVLDTFAGWTTEPNAPPIVILGLSYERDKAVGIVEYIEPGEVWAFIPCGEDERYDIKLRQANRGFWDVLPIDHLIEYRVDKPFECFTSLESLTYGILKSGRPVFVPFGPKIFSLCCLLVSILYYPKVSVWRVSSEQFEPPLDSIPSGKIIGLEAEFYPANFSFR
jgi:hypothetical protein